MLPPRIESPRSPSPAVIALLGAQACALAWLLVAVRPDEAALLVERWGLVPRSFLRSLAGAPDRLWLTPVSAMFLHGGLLHLLGNALYLWIFGRVLEDLLGSRRLLLLFAASGLAAAVLHVAASPDSWVPALGSSGAVSGLLGAYAVSAPGARLRLVGSGVPALGLLLVWIALQGIAGVSSGGQDGGGIAWWAHVGGFCAGAALAGPMWLRAPRHSRVRV